MFQDLLTIKAARQWLSVFHKFDHHTLKKAAFDFFYFDDCWNFEVGSINKTEDCLEAVYSGVKHVLSQMEGSRGGISGHFNLARQRYIESYSGIIGFLIPTLLGISKKYLWLNAETIAVRTGEWLLTQQRKDGGIRCNKGINAPVTGEDLVIAFDCAAVLQGFLALFQHNADKRFAEAAHRLASFLISKQKSNGSWDDICDFNYFGSHNTLVGYSLLLASMTLGEPTYKKAGLACLNFIRPNICDNGFIRKCHFNNDDLDDVAFLHPLAYTIEGYIKTSELTGENYWSEIIYPVIQTLHRIFEVRKEVFLSHYDYRWHSQTNYSAVTSNAQIACVWFKIGRKQNNLLYINSALKMMDILRNILVSSSKNGNGVCVPDAFPIYRGLNPFKCNLLGAKYFLEAFLLELEFRKGIN